MSEEPQGAKGAEGEGASGTPPEPKPEPTEDPKSINSQAKKLPWVLDLEKKAAELARIKQEQADAQAKAEQEKAVAEGNFQKALEMEQKKYEDLNSKYQNDTRRLQLEMEFTRADIVDVRAVQLFMNDYNSEKESAAEFVSRIKADEKNAPYFSNPKKRTPGDPPPAAGIGSGEPFDPSWIKSDDPKKREAAIKRNRSAFWKKFHEGAQ
jgi:hypothetical protein